MIHWTYVLLCLQVTPCDLDICHVIVLWWNVKSLSGDSKKTNGQGDIVPSPLLSAADANVIHVYFGFYLLTCKFELSVCVIVVTIICRRIFPCAEPSAVFSLYVSTAECKRGFTARNHIITDERNRVNVSKPNSLFFIAVYGPHVCSISVQKFAEKWKQNDFVMM